MKQTLTLEEIFSRLWETYIAQNPHAKAVYDCFLAEGEQVINDHIAFRTFDDPRISIDVLARPFLEAGYEQKGYYLFEDKHLVAKHFEHPCDEFAPKIFISQLTLSAFDQEINSIICGVVKQVSETITFSDQLIFAGRPWSPIRYSDYLALKAVSEYAAWMYLFGFGANHFTVSINHLKKLNTIEKVNQFVKSKGFELNSSGGEIKGSPAELLEQSSTQAGLVQVQFEEGSYDIPSCYYEFARRYYDAENKLYNGFIAKSADKIFESTNNRK